MNLFELTWSEVLGAIPGLVAWGIGIVLAIIMVRRGGDKAEKLLLAGCCLMFAVRLISLFLTGLAPWLLEHRISAPEYSFVRSIAAIPALAGIVCLVIAFWVKFMRKKPETA
jgi:hypothetical protein